MKTLSICIPVYRPNKRFTDNINKLFRELSSSIEVLIYVDGQYSEHLDIHAMFKDRAYVFGDEYNIGVAGARNRLISKAKGEYILWLDSDDNIDIANLEILYKMLGTFDILYADRNLLFQDTVKYIKGFSKSDREIKSFSKNALLSHRFNKALGSTATCSKVIRRSVYNNIGVYDKRFCRSEDTEWFTRCLDNEELVFGNFALPLINQVYTNEANKSNKNEWYYHVKILAKNRGEISENDLAFSYHWLSFKYLKKTKSLCILLACFFQRFVLRVASKLKSSHNFISYN